MICVITCRIISFHALCHAQRMNNVMLLVGLLGSGNQRYSCTGTCVEFKSTTIRPFDVKGELIQPEESEYGMFKLEVGDHTFAIGFMINMQVASRDRTTLPDA